MSEPNKVVHTAEGEALPIVEEYLGKRGVSYSLLSGKYGARIVNGQRAQALLRLQNPFGPHVYALILPWHGRTEGPDPEVFCHAVIFNCSRAGFVTPGKIAALIPAGASPIQRSGYCQPSTSRGAKCLRTK